MITGNDKIKITLTCALIFFGVQVFSQCYPGWERCIELYNKGKCDKAIVACNENLLCDSDAEKAGALLCLINIYRDSIPNDSLYINCKKQLVRLGFEYPKGYRMVLVDLDGVEYEDPAVDLYDISRELCCELYDRGEFDSAYFYFTTYARHYHAKGWCGVGKEDDGFYDVLMWSRLFYCTTKSDSSLYWMSKYLDGYEHDYQSYRQPTDLAIFCFYDIFHGLHPAYLNGQLLNELESNAKFSGTWNETIVITTRVKDLKIHLTADRPDSTIADTNKFILSSFQQTALYKCIRYKDMIAHDRVVNIPGHLSSYRGEVIVRGFDRTFLLQGIPGIPAGAENKNVMVSGELISEPIREKNYSWKYDSPLLFPEEQFKWIIKNPVITVPG